MKETLKLCEEKMIKSVKSLENEYASIRAGRASASVLDKITVDYYGVPTAINAMASITVAEAKTLVVQPWDKSVLKEIEKAINASDIGINPQNDGSVIRLNFPPLTEERRKELAKQIKKYAEEGKVSVRAVRRDINDKFKAMKKASEITEDELKECEKKVQDMTDKYVKEIDKVAEKKEKEIMEI